MRQDENLLEEKMREMGALFTEYGAVPTDLALKNTEQFGDRRIYAWNGNYYRTGTAAFDGEDFLLISCIDGLKFAELGIMEDIDLIPAGAERARMERAVRCAFGVEPYPEKYPEDE